MASAVQVTSTVAPVLYTEAVTETQTQTSTTQTSTATVAEFTPQAFPTETQTSTTTVVELTQQASATETQTSTVTLTNLTQQAATAEGAAGDIEGVNSTATAQLVVTEVALQCNLKCLGNASTIVPLIGGVDEVQAATDLEGCRSYCFATDGCEAVVYSNETCSGVKDILIGKCDVAEGFVTDMVTTYPYGTCTIMGDLFTFDDPTGRYGTQHQVRSLSPGEYWLVKSSTLWIQARFSYSSQVAGAVLTGMAVSGDLMQGRRFVIVYQGGAGKVYWNGTELNSTAFPWNFDSEDGFLTAYLDVVNPADFSEEARGMLTNFTNMTAFMFRVQPHIRIYMIARFDGLAAVITMRKLHGGQDGYCGKFDCLPLDDSLQSLGVLGLADPITNMSQNLFNFTPVSEAASLPISPSSLEDCQINNTGLYQQAQAACASLTGGFMTSCLADVCGSGQLIGAQEATQAAALSHEVTRMFSLLWRLQLPHFGSMGISPLMQASIALLVAALGVGGFAFGCMSRNIPGGPHLYDRLPLVEVEEVPGRRETAVLPAETADWYDLDQQDEETCLLRHSDE